MKSLFKEFKPSSKKEWLAKVEKDLKGKPLESLNWQLNDDFIISPFAHAQDLKESKIPLQGKRATNTWEKGVWILVKNHKSANREALSLLEKGANAICFDFVKNPNQKELKILLAGIQLEWISIHLILNKRFWKTTIKNLISICQKRSFDLKKISGSFQLREEYIRPSDFNVLNQFLDQLPLFNLVSINGRQFYGGKDHLRFELLQTIHQANRYLENWNDQNLNLSGFIKKFQFSIQLDDSYYLNIAKIRALKILWQMLVKAWSPSLKVTCHIEAHLTTETATDDQNYNKIKATSQAMAAVIGGANRLFIYPSDAFKNKKGTQNQQRLALNIQNLMEMESYMDRVIDPAAGSYFLEKLTDDIAESVWEKFKDVQS